MNVIKKTAILFIIILSACSTDTNQETFEEQNTLITSDLRTQEENSTFGIFIRFAEEIGEEERESIRTHLIEEEIIINYEILSYEKGIDNWDIILCPDALGIGVKKCRELGKRCPCTTPVGELEDDGVLKILTPPFNLPGQN